jgi:hypothetical protein
MNLKRAWEGAAAVAYLKRDGIKSRKVSVRIFVVPAEIRSGYLQKAS